MPPSPPALPPPPAPPAKRRRAEISFVDGKDRSEGEEWVVGTGATRARRRMGPAGSVLTWAASPEEGDSGAGGGKDGGKEAEEDDELRIGASQRGPGYPPGAGFDIDEWDAQPTVESAGAKAEAGKEVMDLTGVPSDEDSDDERERRAASAWAAAERRVLRLPSSAPSSPAPTADDFWRESDEDFHPPLARRHYAALHSLGTMLDTLSVPVRARYNSTHPKSAAHALAAAELRALDLFTSMLGSLKSHAREEAEDEREHQVERMQTITYRDSPPPPE
ncbi:hypothetical protein JCM8097_007501 [Rhodosporidiobolus ruineniae]